ncbi:MAG: hypothetical protein ACI8XB_000259 [Patiriisocius sp.]|jgi:hypothetical protein
MIRLILVFCLLCYFSIKAQDYTNAINDGERIAPKSKVLIVPFKSQFLLSEIDRGLIQQSSLEVMSIRRKIPEYLIEKIGAGFEDSVATKSLYTDLDASNLSYIQHNLAYGYEELIVEEEKSNKLKRLLKNNDAKKKRSNAEVKGYNTAVNQGQINKDPIFKERYMSAKMKSEELINFIVSEYDPDISIILTELDLMKARNEKTLEGFEYIATLHYCMFSRDGKLLEGNKIEQYFNRSEFNLLKLESEVLQLMSETIRDRSMVYLNKNLSTEESVDEDNDY